MWIYLSSLNSTFGVTPDQPLITDEEDIINKAIRKPDLKVSTFMLTANAEEIEFSPQDIRLSSDPPSHQSSTVYTEHYKEHVLWSWTKLSSNLSFILLNCRALVLLPNSFKLLFPHV